MDEREPDESVEERRVADLLRALDAPPDPTAEDRVVGAAMARIGARPRRAPAAAERPSLWDDVVYWTRPGLAAAAAFALAAGGVLLVRRPAPRAGAAADPERQLLEWLETNRVPTAAELLVTFQGYPR